MTHPFFVIELKADFSLADCVDFINAVTENGQKTFLNLFVALPFFRLKEMTEKFPDSGITFGTALFNDSDPESFTASIAGKIIKDAKGQFTLIGSSYERNGLNLSQDQLENKLKEALKSNLKPIFCVGGGKAIDVEGLVHQLQPLKNTQWMEQSTHPTLIFESDFHNFESYLPSSKELNAALDLVKHALQEVFGEESAKIAILVALPADLIGFSNLIESLPFQGAYFIKSGAYPHSVHDETVKLVHVHCENNNN